MHDQFTFSMILFHLSAKLRAVRFSSVPTTWACVEEGDWDPIYHERSTVLLTSRTILQIAASPTRILVIISLAAVWCIERGVSAAVIKGQITACGKERETPRRKLCSEARNASSLAPSLAMS